MAMTRQGEMRKDTRRHRGRRKGDIEKITIIGEKDTEQEVTVCYEALPQKKASSVWRWHEEFAAEWSETFLFRK
jgi:hypothetical protein